MAITSESILDESKSTEYNYSFVLYQHRVSTITRLLYKRNEVIFEKSTKLV
jgi:hypothetical protein